MIIEIFISGPLENNTILLGCSKTKKAAVVDPADAGREVLDFAGKHGLQIEKILLTHAHFDHVGDVSFLKEKTHADVYIHAEDAAILENTKKEKFSFLQKEIISIKPDYLLQDHEKLRVGDIVIEILHTPGHTMGSVCFFIEKESLLLSGDTLFKGAMGRIVSAPAMKASLTRLSTLPSETKVIPGHGSATTIGKEKWLHKIFDFPEFK